MDGTQRDGGHVVVVGGGIVGLSTARALLKRGLAVTVVERGPIPNPLAASSDHHRMIRHAYGEEAVYCRRIVEAFAAWRDMWADLGGPETRYYAERGVLTLIEAPGDRGDRSRRTLERLGVPHEVFASSAALAGRFPHLDPGNVSGGFLTDGGALMANRILADLADWLRRAGAAVLEHSPAASVDRDAGTVTLADGRSIGGDLVLVTAGAGMAALVPEFAGRLRANRCLIVYADPPEDLADAWSRAPCWSNLAGPNDLWGIAPVEGLPLKLGSGALGRLDPADDDRAVAGAEIDAMIDAYRGRFRGIERFRVRFAQANYWMLADEERFVLERDGRMVAVSACSGHGFKFGALSGLDLAAALTGAEPFGAVATRMAGREAEPA